MLVQHLLAVWYVSVHQDAFQVAQRWNCVQEEYGHCHEGRRQRVLDIIPRRYTNFQRRTLVTFQTSSLGGTSTHGRGNQDTTMQD